MKLHPRNDQVLVELDPFEETYGDTDLVRPDIGLEKPRWGTVRGVGPGIPTKRGFKETTLKSGDRVLVPWARGRDIKIGGRAFVFVREFNDREGGDILAVEDAA